MRDEIRLILFFTEGVSLRDWDAIGSLPREVALYQRLQERGVQTTFVTYGDERDLAYADRIPGIRICCNVNGLPRCVGEPPPWLDADAMAEADLVKTNQTPGADLALAAARRAGKPLIARCGYLWSDSAVRKQGEASPAACRAFQVEDDVFPAADRVVVTTEAMKANILARHPQVAARVRVIPNYVDTDAFCPAEGLRPPGSHLCYVGRWEEPQKNLRALIEAVRDLDVALDLIGEGPLRREFEAEAATNPRLHLVGRVSSDALPNHLRRCGAFVLPSRWEGHPKALIEAMACGLAAISTDMPGIRELVRHGETGWLCGTDAASLREGMRRVAGDPALCDRLGNAARAFVEEHFALRRIVDMELDVYREVVGADREPTAALPAR